MSTQLIKAQQQILKDLGLYQGEVDGFWGPNSMSAMSGFQHTEGFAGLPARKTNQFFAPFEALPKGWTWAADGSTVAVGAAPAPVAPVAEPVATVEVPTAIVETVVEEIVSDGTEEVVVASSAAPTFGKRNR